MLNFDASDWSTPKTVYVLGVEDDLSGGSVDFEVTVGVDATGTLDSDYDALSGSPVRVYLSKTDNDAAVSAGLTISPEPDGSSRLETPEDGTSPASFTVVLDTLPTDAVVLTVTSLSAGDGLVSAVSSGGAASIMLNFDASDWSTPKTVYVLGVEDDLSGGSVDFEVTVGVDATGTLDSDYDALAGSPVSVYLSKTDNDAPVSAGLTISPEPDGSSRLDTPEDGTSPASFTVVLDTLPTDAVVLAVTSLSAGDGLVSAVSSGGAASIMLNFDASDWSTPKTVYVLGVEDDLSGGSVDFEVTVGVDATGTLDSDYDALSGSPVRVYLSKTDNDAAVSAGLTISPEPDGSSRLNTSEDGTSPASFTVVLDTLPTDVVVLTVTGSPGQGVVSTVPSGGAASIMLNFDATNWDTAQEVYVLGVEDDLSGGSVDFEVTVGVDATGTLDSDYDALSGSPVSVYLSKTDNDAAVSAGLTISPEPDGSSRLNTSEDGTSPASFTVVLDMLPTDVVVLTVTGSPGQGVVSTVPSGGAASIELNFDATNWDTAQEVYVLGVEDDVSGGSVDFEVTVGVDATGTLDSDYNALSAVSVFLSKIDNDAPASLAPDAPRDLRAISSLGSTTIELSWGPPVSDGGSVITGYRIESSSSGSDPWTEVATTMGALALTYSHDNGLVDGATVHYRVIAVNAVGDSAASETVTAVVGAAVVDAVPGRPFDLVAYSPSGSTTTIMLHWRAPSSDGGSEITGYRIEYSTDDGTLWSDLVADTMDTSLVYLHENLTANDEIHYRIYGINGEGEGAVSDTVSATVGEETLTVADSPTGLAGVVSGTSVTLTWEAPVDDGGSLITGYKIEFSTDGTTWQVEQESETELTYLDEDLTAGETYHYRVYALNVVGESDATDSIQVQIPVRDIAFGSFLEHFRVRVYPNPAEDLLYVDLPEGTGYHVRILSLTGARVFEATVGGGLNTLDIGLIGRGVYLLVVDTEEDRIFGGRFLKR